MGPDDLSDSSIKDKKLVSDFQIFRHTNITCKSNWSLSSSTCYRIAIALGGLATPPGMFSGADVKKKLQRFADSHSAARRSKSNSSPAIRCKSVLNKEWQTRADIPTGHPNPDRITGCSCRSDGVPASMPSKNVHRHAGKPLTRFLKCRHVPSYS